jgi:hypothetical protein
VGLISVTSTFADPQAIAENPNGKVPGRFGVNPLRIIRFTNVTADQMKNLRQIRDEYPGSDNSGEAAGVIGSPAYYFPYKPRENELDLFGVWYRIGDKPGYSYEMNPVDEREILQSIREAKQYCDFLIVVVHSHETPSDFDTKIAHEGIDAGADEWMVSGPFRVGGIEIYKNRPIFHSLGALFFEVGLASMPAPQESLEDDGETAAEISARHWGNSPDPSYRSAIAVSTFKNNLLSEIRIYPIDLGWERIPSHRGAPAIAAPDIAQKILEKAKTESASYGTNISIEGNIGVIRVGSPSK